MKVAVFTDTYHPQKNGVVVFIQDMLTELPKHAEVVVFAPGDGRRMKVKTDKSSGIKTYWVPAYPFPLYEGYKISRIRRKKILKILEKEKPDIVHSHAPVLLGMRALLVSKALGIPSIATHHTHLPDYVLHLSKGLLKWKFADIAKLSVQKVMAALYTKADVVTAPTDALKD